MTPPPSTRTLVIICGFTGCASDHLAQRERTLVTCYSKASDLPPVVLHLDGASLSLTHPLLIDAALAELRPAMLGTTLVHLEVHEGCAFVAEYLGKSAGEFDNPHVAYDTLLGTVRAATHVILDASVQLTRRPVSLTLEQLRERSTSATLALLRRRPVQVTSRLYHRNGDLERIDARVSVPA